MDYSVLEHDVEGNAFGRGIGKHGHRQILFKVAGLNLGSIIQSANICGKYSFDSFRHTAGCCRVGGVHVVLDGSLYYRDRAGKVILLIHAEAVIANGRNRVRARKGTIVYASAY